MTGFTEEEIVDQLETVSVLAVVAGVQVGGLIPDGHVRKITRLHIRGVVGTTIRIGLYQGDATDNFEDLVDSFEIVNGNPDHTESANQLQAPLFLIRPDETRPAQVPVDEVNDVLTIRRDVGADSQVTITFYDDRA